MKSPDYQNNKNNQLFHLALSRLNIRFPVAEIERKTGAGKGNISNYIHNKKPISDNFLNNFAKGFNLDLDELKVELANQENKNHNP